MALSERSLAAASVLQSIFALACVQRDGVQCQAMRHQRNALAFMRQSLAKGLSAKEACMHVAAGMLLAAFEVAIPKFLDPYDRSLEVIADLSVCSSFPCRRHLHAP